MITHNMPYNIFLYQRLILYNSLLFYKVFSAIIITRLINNKLEFHNYGKHDRKREHEADGKYRQASGKN